MKRGLKKTFFMVKGTKKRSAKKRAMKHTPPNGMITSPIVSGGDFSQNAVLMGSTSSNNEEKMNRNVTKNKNTKKL